VEHGRVVVVDDGSLTIKGALRSLVDTPWQWAVEVVDAPGRVFCDALPSRRQGAVLLLTHPEARRLHTAGELDALVVEFRVLMLGGDLRSPHLGDWLRRGVRGFLTSETTEPTLLAAVRTVAAGGFFFPAELEEALTGHVGGPAGDMDPPAGADGLRPVPVPIPITARETEVLRLIAAGLTHKQAGNRLGLTKSTVDTYVQRVRQKLKAGNKADLTRVAAERGLTLAVVGDRPLGSEGRTHAS
jgi:DNA-binding NarL/FixJ family response regulator